ncbi:MAG: hypothetical protein E7456_01275 [Ruminococcaceae bacterium]|nr:hypothetical protein [Oscillospiraceae bacterium]
MNRPTDKPEPEINNELEVEHSEPVVQPETEAITVNETVHGQLTDSEHEKTYVFTPEADGCYVFSVYGFDRDKGCNIRIASNLSNAEQIEFNCSYSALDMLAGVPYSITVYQTSGVCDFVMEVHLFEENSEDVEYANDNYDISYLDKMSVLAFAYGSSSNSLIIEECYTDKGLNYTDLIDFDNNGTNELLCVCDGRALIYSQTNGNVECLLDVKAEGSYGVTYVQNRVYIAQVDGKTWISVNHSNDAWLEDSWTAYTLTNGVVESIEFYAKRNEADTEDFPTTDNLNEFWIDGVSVDKEEYLAAYDMYRQGDNVFWFDAYDVSKEITDSIQKTIDKIWDE